LKQVINRQPDEHGRDGDGDPEYFFLDAALSRISAAALSESRAEARAAALLQQHQAGKGDGDHDLSDWDNIVHNIELTIIMIRVVTKSGNSPCICNSGVRMSAIATIDISITRLNKLKVKIRSGSDNTFSTGAIARLSKAMAKPVNAKTFQSPV